MNTNNLQKISFKEYKSIDALSRSDLLNLHHSLEFYKYLKENEIKETESMRIGKMFHKFILENETFNEEYYVLKEKIDRRTTQGKARYEQIKIESSNKEIIDIEEFETINEMRNSLLSNELITSKNLLKNELTEQTIVWDNKIEVDDNKYTEKCKCRLDKVLMTDNGTSIVELKTCCNISSFESDIFFMRYHIQASFYIDALNSVISSNPDMKPFKKFIFIVIEKRPPYVNRIFTIDCNNESIEIGRMEYKNLLSKYIRHKNNNFKNENFATEVTIPSSYRTIY